VVVINSTTAIETFLTRTKVVVISTQLTTTHILVVRNITTEKVCDRYTFNDGAYNDN
jgi:hypothetical protein